jgi:outer membrane protein TolC
MPLKAVLSKFLTVGLILTLSYVDGAVAVAASSSQLPAELSILDVPLKRLCGISPELERSRADQEIAISNARVRSLYLIPKVSLAADLGVQDSTSGSATGALGLIAELNLNPLLAPYYGSQQADLNLQSIRLKRTTALQSEFEKFIDQALALSSLWWRDEDLEETKLRLEKQYRTLQQNVRAGVARQRDQYRFEADLLRLQESRLSLKRQIVEAQEKIAVLAPGPSEERPPSGAHFQPGFLDWKSLLKLKLENIDKLITSPSLEIQRLRVEIAEVEARIANQSTGLTAGLSAAIESRNSDLAPRWSQASIREPYQTSWFTLLSFRYPIWDAGSDRLKLQEASEAVRVARLSLALSERDFSSRKALLEDEKKRLEERIQLANRLNLLERKSFNLVATDYREGRAGYLDWIGASESLQNSVRAQIELAGDWARLWIKIKMLKGEMADEICD